MYEFVTEIIFPVSPCFGLAIMHALGGLLSLLVSMIADDILSKNPNNESFPIVVYVLSALVCSVAFFIIYRNPYKLNRTDYDLGRRSTMIASYGV